MTTWPKLSESLPHRTPGRCQKCNAPGTLTYWQECDEFDRPTVRFVALCINCSDIIEPHPRLYRSTLPDTPMPGLMPICYDCPAQQALACTSPLAKFNGGTGLQYEPEGNTAIVCSRASGCRHVYLPRGPVTACTGKTAATNPQDGTPIR